MADITQLDTVKEILFGEQKRENESQIKELEDRIQKKIEETHTQLVQNQERQHQELIQKIESLQHSMLSQKNELTEKKVSRQQLADIFRELANTVSSDET
jgi:hypothetical protein